MVFAYIIPIFVIIASVWNLIKKPMNIDSTLTIKAFKKSPEVWKFSQKLFAIQALIINLVFLISIIIIDEKEFLKDSFVRFLIIIIMELFPLVTTYIIVKVKYKN